MDRKQALKLVKKLNKKLMESKVEGQVRLYVNKDIELSIHFTHFDERYTRVGNRFISIYEFMDEEAVEEAVNKILKVIDEGGLLDD